MWWIWHLLKVYFDYWFELCIINNFAICPENHVSVERINVYLVQSNQKLPWI